MLGLLLALAAIQGNFAAPKPDNVANWISGNDYPSALLPHRMVAIVGVTLTLSPEGKPIRCDISRSSGIPDVDSYTCAILMKRGKYKPAKDAAGNPMFGIERTHIVWQTAPGTIDYNGDFEVPVDRLPQGSKRRSQRIAFAVDENGAVDWCGPFEPKDRRPDLVQVACGGLVDRIRIEPARNEAGIAVPSVQDALIHFVTDIQDIRSRH